MIDEFYLSYNLFASQKGIDPLKSSGLRIYSKQGRILLSRVIDHNNVVLCYHV